MIEAIMFDLDGTLIGQKTASSNILKQLYSENKKKFREITQKEFLESWFKVAKKNIQEFFRGEITFEDKVISQISDLFSIFDYKLNKSQAKEIYDKLLPIYEKNIKLYDDVIPCLEMLKKEGFRLGIITNGHSKDQREKLIRYNLKSYFSPIIVSGDIGFAKPNKEIFLECIKLLDLPPQNILYVGDLVEMDVLGANKVGIKGVWINRNNQEREHDIISIRSLMELEALIKKGITN
ncbi:MAG: HAD family hydrolase [Candidatus Hodarchaeota archaeon]